VSYNIAKTCNLCLSGAASGVSERQIQINSPEAKEESAFLKSVAMETPCIYEQPSLSASELLFDLMPYQ